MASAISPSDGKWKHVFETEDSSSIQIQERNEKLSRSRVLEMGGRGGRMVEIADAKVDTKGRKSLGNRCLMHFPSFNGSLAVAVGNNVQPIPI